MINEHDAEIYYGIAVDKKDTIEQIKYALLSIAHSLLNDNNKVRIKGGKEFVKNIEKVVSEGSIKKSTESDSNLESTPLDCTRCMDRVETGIGELVYWFGDKPFCSGICRAKWKEEHPGEVSVSSEGVKKKKVASSRAGSSGGVL